MDVTTVTFHDIGIVNRGKVRAPALPDWLQFQLGQLGDASAARIVVASQLDAARNTLGQLPATAILRADLEISKAAKLNWHRASPRFYWPDLQSRATDLELLRLTPRLEYLYIFHRDGYLREASLKKISGGLPSPFWFAAISWRMNDWGIPVQVAARRCAERVFPLTDAKVIAVAEVALLRRMQSWYRWRNETGLIYEAFRRGEVVNELKQTLVTGTMGGLGWILRSLLQRPDHDQLLPILARDARLPEIRAIAARALFDGHAKWPIGQTWEWADKSLGRKRRIPVFDRRPLTVSVPLTELLRHAAKDKAAIVRSTAAGALVQHYATLENRDEIIGLLISDKNLSIQARADFVVRQLRKSDVPKS